MQQPFPTCETFTIVEHLFLISHLFYMFPRYFSFTLCSCFFVVSFIQSPSCLVCFPPLQSAFSPFCWHPPNLLIISSFCLSAHLFHIQINLSEFLPSYWYCSISLFSFPHFLSYPPFNVVTPTFIPHAERPKLEMAEENLILGLFLPKTGVKQNKTHKKVQGDNF